MPAMRKILLILIFAILILLLTFFLTFGPGPEDGIKNDTITLQPPVIKSISDLTPYKHCNASAELGGFRKGSLNFSYYICETPLLEEEERTIVVAGFLNSSMDLQAKKVVFPYSFPEIGLQINETFSLAKTGPYSHLVGNGGIVFCGNCSQGDSFLLFHKFVILEKTIREVLERGEYLYYFHLEELCKLVEHCRHNEVLGNVVSWEFKNGGKNYSVDFFPDPNSVEYRLIEDKALQERYRDRNWTVDAGDGYVCLSPKAGVFACLTKTKNNALIRVDSSESIDFENDVFGKNLREYIERFG